MCSTAWPHARRFRPRAPGSCPTPPSTACCGRRTASRWSAGPTPNTWTTNRCAMKPIPEPLLATIGQRVDLIDTPALVVDLDAMDRNIQRMADFARKHQVRWRPHAKMHKSAELALLQQRAGAQGVCVQKVAEAEALAA